MFKRLYIDNYKCLVNLELPLRELTLLVGTNGTGKTSILDVVFALRRILSGEVRITDRGVFPSSTLTRWQSRGLQTFEIEVSLGGEELVYRLEVEHQRSPSGITWAAQGSRARILLERLTADQRPLFHFAEGKVQLYRDDHSHGPKYDSDWTESALARVPSYGDKNRRLTGFLDFVRRVLVCGLYPASFESESKTEDPILARDARNFAAWYRHVSLERPELVPKLTEELREIIDGFQGMFLEREGEYTRTLMVTFRDAEESPSYKLRFDEISDGQRALVALYALIRLGAGQGYTLFLDEPDNYVGLSEIQPWLVELADACGESAPQAVLCSHHPELIDYLGQDRGLLLGRQRSGVTTVQSMEKTPTEGGLRLSELVARGWER